MFEIFLWWAIASVLFFAAIFLGKTIYRNSAVKRIYLYCSTIALANFTALIVFGYLPFPVVDLSSWNEVILTNSVSELTPPLIANKNANKEKHRIAGSETIVSSFVQTTPEEELSSTPSTILRSFSPPVISIALLSAWAIGSIYSILLVFGEYSASKKLLTNCQPLNDQDIANAASRAASKLNLKTMPPILLSERAISPCVVDPFRPKVVVPAVSLQQLDKNDWQAIFVHEFSHIKNRDLAWNFFLRIGIAFHWFNPLSYRVIKNLRISQEERCDNQVIQSSDRYEYAKLLVMVNQICQPSIRLLSTAMTSRTTTTQNRVHWILDPNRDRNTRSNPAWRWASNTIAVTLSIAIGSLMTLTDNTTSAQELQKNNNEISKPNAADQKELTENSAQASASKESNLSQVQECLHSDRFIRKISEYNIELAVEKANGRIIKIPVLKVIPAGKTISRKDLFEKLGLKEKKITKFRRHILNNVCFLSWKVSPSYKIVLMTAVRDPKNKGLAWNDPRRQVYGVRFASTKIYRKRTDAAIKKAQEFLKATIFSAKGIGRTTSRALSAMSIRHFL